MGLGGVAVAARAERRAAARDVPPLGSLPSSSLSYPPSPIWLVLPSFSDDHLLRILEGVGVSFDAGFGSPAAVLAIIHANEVAHAAIEKAKDLAAVNGVAAAQASVEVGATGSGQAPLRLLSGSLLSVPNLVWPLQVESSYKKPFFQMRALFWNIRGFGARGRRDQIRDVVRGENIDVIGLVETFKVSFSPNGLSAVAGLDRFNWDFLPSSGHSGGILLGTKRDVFDRVAFDHGVFWASSMVHHRSLNRLFEIMVVYGPADHSLSSLFLDEIANKIDACALPLLIGGDFNLLRSHADKSSSNFSWPLADAFNSFIRDCTLHELPRVGARFTWSNRQANPIHSVLDRVFICPAWDI